ncbi:LysR family transcriptional regulator [Rhodobacteraceae bacterium NNCM2]|nr:LysR family transcriptional regulator [Coraliihabitans acroporae]
MYLETRHLRGIRAIHEAGGLAKAAEQLNLTQSALSHQMKTLEELVGLSLFVRRSKPLKLSPAGHKLLTLAGQILPAIEALEGEFKGHVDGRTGRLFIAIECHACFEWLIPVLETFRTRWPDVDVDIRPGLSFDALPALGREEVDLVISSDPEDIPGVKFKPLFAYQPVFVAAGDHPYAAKPFIDAADLADQTLITYPVDRSKLDVFSQLLDPAGVDPREQRQIELTAVILLLVASGKGVAVLPDWVVSDEGQRHRFTVRHLTSTDGIFRTLYAAGREAELSQPYLVDFINIAGAHGRKRRLIGD